MTDYHAGVYIAPRGMVDAPDCFLSRTERTPTIAFSEKTTGAVFLVTLGQHDAPEAYLTQWISKLTLLRDEVRQQKEDESALVSLLDELEGRA